MYLRRSVPGPIDQPASSEAAQWVVGRLNEDWRQVGGWVPGGFGTYVRVLHPAGGSPQDRSDLGDVVKWRDIAAWSGQPLTATADYCTIERRDDGTSWGAQRDMSAPAIGELRGPSQSRLLELLSHHTTTPGRLRVLVWHGYGRSSGEGYAPTRGRRPIASGRPARRFGRVRGDPLLGANLVEVSATLTATGRRYVAAEGLLAAGSAEEGTIPDNPPNMWWPADRAWFVSTDIDAYSTYVAGSAQLTAELLADDVLEAFPAFPTDPFDGGHEPDQLRGHRDAEAEAGP